MKKKVLTLILCMSALCILSGCGTGEEQKNAETQQSEAGTSEIDSQSTEMENTEAAENDADAVVQAEMETESKPVIPEYDSTNFEDISVVAEALGFFFTPVENFSNGFAFTSFGFDKKDNLMISYSKDNPDDSTENRGFTVIITSEEYIPDVAFDEARALEGAVIEDIPVKERLYTHYNCEGDWRSLLTEDELNEMMAAFESGAANGGETNLKEEAIIEIKKHYYLRWQQNEEFWVSVENIIPKPQWVNLEDLEVVAQELIQINK